MNDIIQTYYSYCLQANLKGGLRTVKNANRSKKKNVNALRRKVIRRFIEKNDVCRIQCSDRFVKTIISAYREYYREALLRPDRRIASSSQLDLSLREIAKSESIRISPNASREGLEKVLSHEIKRRGYHSLFGTVSPFRSLLIWKKQTKKKYLVSLPEGKQRVDVIFMEDFLELSWLHYATFGKYYVGGWAKKEALYCVKKAYRVNSQNFKVHYLAHEAQHFSDYKQFPKLHQTDLEYRAKLTELALTKTPARFLEKLRLEANNDINNPHSFAAYKILCIIDSSTSRSKVSYIARNLLSEHTKILKSRRANVTKSVLDSR